MHGRHPLTSSPAVLRFDRVTKSYESHTARTLGRSRRHAARVTVLEDLSFSVGHGETVGILGRNGAGKSTLLKLISKVTAPDEGTITVVGRIGSLLEVGTGFHPELTGEENVFLNASILGMKRSAVASVYDQIVEFAELGEAMQRPLKHFSSGMQVRLGFSVAAHLDCDLLLMDEVIAVGDALFQARCLRKLHELCTQEGRTALIVSHAMAPVARLCSRAIVLDSGHVAFDGDTAGAIAHYIRSLQGGFTSSGSVVDLSARVNPYGDDLWIQSVEALDTPADPTIRSFRVRIELRSPTTRDLVVGLGVSDNIGVGVTAGFLELPPVRPDQVGKTAAVTLTVPIGSMSPGVYFLDLGLSEGLGSHVMDQVRRAVAINADSTSPEDWRLRYGDAVIALPITTSWILEP